MEDKQLDFNAPLLSVRRFNSTSISRVGDDKKPSNLPTLSRASIPLYKSDFKSGPLRNPGTVPFQWELSPGRPKDVALKSERFDQPCVIPKLPPGRKIGEKHRSIAKVEKSEYSMIGQLNIDNSTKLQDSKDEEKQMIQYYPNLYSDAFDGLSFSMNYSFTGVSATDGSEMKSSKNFQGEWNPQNFMMARFLPAAKEIALEAPSCHSRKQLGFIESVKKEKITFERKEPIDRSKIHVIPKYTPDAQGKDDDDDAYDSDSEFTTKTCGLFPGLCLGSSVGLLNPLSGMKMRNRVPLSPVHEDHNQIKAIRHESSGEAIDQEFINNKHQMIHGLDFLGDLKDKKCGKKGNDINENAKECSLRYLLDKEVTFDLISQNYTHGKTKEQNDSGNKDVKKEDEQPKVLESPTPHFSHCFDQLGNDGGMKNTGELQSKRNDYVELEGDIAEVESLKIPVHGGFHEAQDSKFSKESSLYTSFQLPLPPPLPQSPSESWLRRALPSISSKNPSIGPYLGDKIDFKKQRF